MMRKEYLLAITAFFMLSFTTVAITYAGEQAEPTHSIIHTYTVDINEDGKKDKIVLKGIHDEQSQSYYKKIWATISIGNNPKMRINYEPGYEPKLEFADLNHDGIKDLLGSSATGGSGGLYNYRLDSIKNNQAVSIPLPAPLNIQGQFEDGFKAMLTIPETNETIHLDLASRKNDYIRSGLYLANGKLNEASELMIDPVAMYKIVKIKGKSGVGLQSFRQISGAYHADLLGVLKATYYDDHGKWNLVKTNWREK